MQSSARPTAEGTQKLMPKIRVRGASWVAFETGVSNAKDGLNDAERFQGSQRGCADPALSQPKWLPVSVELGVEKVLLKMRFRPRADGRVQSADGIGSLEL